MRERGSPIPAEEWWLRLARSLIANDPRDLTALGIALAKHVKRRAPFSHSQLSRFASGAERGVATLELAQALCTEYTRLPKPAFFPRSYEEAVYMQGVSERYERSVPAIEEPVVIAMPTERRTRRRVAPATPEVSALAQHQKRRRTRSA